MDRKKSALLTFNPAHPTDLTLFVPLTISRGLFLKKLPPGRPPQKLFIIVLQIHKIAKKDARLKAG